jgi:heat shock protein HslJ/uncharacterized lipoprotein NlpE involved in copper resistance
VTLLPDSTFRLRRVYRGRPTVVHSLGRWSVDENGTQLVLRGSGETPQRFAIVGADSLRMLDTLGRPIQSPFNQSLARTQQVDPVRDTMQLRGMFSYMADAGRFTECSSGATFPVAKLGANAALEQAYLALQPRPGVAVPVAFRGHFGELAGMEEGQRMEHVVVDSVERVGSGPACEERMSNAESNAQLKGTHWTLLELGGTPVHVTQGMAEPPYLQLDTAQANAYGDTGCNRFSGPYELTGDSLHFGALVSTRRACLDEAMNQQESTFLKALSDTRRWQVSSDTLVLSGEAGVLARFSARRPTGNR